MNLFFNIDSKILRALSKLGDIILVSLLWLLFSIPIFTIGPSTTALYYTCVKVIRYDRNYVWQSFWKSFKENFGNATILWLVMVTVYAILGINIWVTFHLFGKTAGLLLRYVYVLMIMICVLSGIYIFPVQSRFVMGKGQILKLSILMGMRHLPFSVGIVLIAAIAILVVYLVTPFIIVMPAATTLFISVFMERVLKKYMPEAKDKSADQWYLE